MKLNKEELKKKIDEKVEDEDLKIELLEDIEDSVDVIKEDETEKVEKTAYDDVVAERDEIKRKYIERFLNGEEVKEDENKEDDEDLKEEEIIDVKEI